MEIKTKFNVGDGVYYINSYTGVKKSTIHCIQLFIYKDRIFPEYHINGLINRISFPECELFATKEEAKEYWKANKRRLNN